MKSLEDQYIQNLKITPSIISQLTGLSEFKGKEILYQRQSKDVLEKLVDDAKIESAESSNRIEGVICSHARIKALVKKNSAPKKSNRPEQEVAGYRDALKMIHENAENMPLENNNILMLHSLLYRYTNVKAGEWKKSENQIVEKLPDGKIKVRFEPVSAFKTPDHMTSLIQNYHFQLNEQKTDPLILIPLVVLDFLCVHPFTDGNGRVGRLLTLQLLYHAGFQVGKYISLERIIEQSKETYYEALYRSSQKWHQGKHDSMPWLRYFYGMLTAAYNEFENNVGVFKEKGTKTERLIKAIHRFKQPFSAGDLQDACPDAKIDLVRKVLKDLRKAGDIEPTGRGRYAKWRHLSK